MNELQSTPETINQQPTKERTLPETDPTLQGVEDVEAFIQQHKAEEKARAEALRLAGGLLNDHHKRLLAERAIRLDVAVAAGLRTRIGDTVEYREWRKKYRLPRAAEEIEDLEGECPFPMDSLFQPYQRDHEGQLLNSRLRYDDTTFRTWSDEMDTSGVSGRWIDTPCPRYQSKPGVPVCPYIPALLDGEEARGMFAVTDDDPLFITEAPLKCLSLHSHGFKGIGLGGVLAGCHEKRADKRLKVTAHPEMMRVNWHGRRAYTVFDAGMTTNPMVALGVAYCWQALSGLGAEVYTLTIPERTSGKTAKARDQGPDDFLFAHGKASFEALVDAAYPTDPLERVMVVAALEKAERTRGALTLGRDLVFRACLSLLDSAGLKEVARVGKGIFTARDLKDLVSSFRASMQPKEDDSTTDRLELEKPSNANLARVVVSQIAKARSPSLLEVDPLDRVVGDLGSVWAHDETSGLWDELDENLLSCEVQAMDGARVKGADKPWYVQSTVASLDMLRARVSRPGFFAAGPRGVAFKNGFVSVENGHVRLGPPGFSNRVRWAYDFDYIDNPNPRLTWSYFERVFQGDPDWVDKGLCMMEYAGCGILGIGSYFNKACLLFDEFGGGTGKSQWLQLLYDGNGISLYPPGSVSTIPPHKVCADGNSGDFHRAKLAGIRANIVNELPSAELSDDDTFKAMTDGNPISGRRSGKDPFTFVFEGNQWYAGNTLMGVLDQSDAFFDRWVLIHFRNRIRGTTGEVRHYYKKMWEERAHLVSYCIQAAATAVARGHLTIPASSVEMIGKWREESNVVAGFVKEQTIPVTPERQPFDGTNKFAMWPVFREWTERGRQSSKMSRPLFFKRLTALVGEPTKYETRNAYPFRLRTPDELLEEDHSHLRLIGGVGVNDVDNEDGDVEDILRNV